jgi:excisionase family DNA binding protein
VEVYTLSPGDTTKIINKCTQFVVREIHCGRLTAVKVGRTFRIAQEDLDDYLERSIVQPRSQHSDEFQEVEQINQ